MGMTIEDIVQGLKETYIICNSVFAYDRKKYIDGAIDRIRKYQKIEQILSDWINDDLVGMSDYWMGRIKEVVEDGNND